MTEAAKPKAYSYIRLSTAIQLRGDGLRRQLERTREFAVHHSLDLDEHLSGEDLGISAFRGKNAVDGALGKILEAIRDRRIAEGSWLLVESLDRISRQDALKAVTLFSEILNAGVLVATTSNGVIYRNNADPGQLFMMLGEFLRSHSESQTKSFRHLENWSGKRSRAPGKKMTAMCPRWLELLSDGTFRVIPDRADIVRRIFNESIAGIGIAATAKRLNDDKVALFDREHFKRKSDGWHPSYIHKILTNPAVLGELQPHKREGKKSIPVGPAIENYFPALITADVFHAAAALRQQRSVTGRGRKGAAFTNLFAGLLKCQYCGRRMHFENKGNGPKGGKYLICEGAARNLDCEKVRWRYDDFEDSVLAFVEEIDLGALYTEGATTEARAEIRNRMQAIDGEVVSLKRAQDNLTQLVEQHGMHNVPNVAGRLRQNQSRIESLSNEKQRKGDELQLMVETARQYYDSKDRIKELVARLRAGHSPDLYMERAQIASRLSALIDQIALAPSGDMPKQRRWNNRLKRVADHLGDPELSDLVQRSERSQRSEVSRRYFTAIFKDGRSRRVTPYDDDPWRFHQMIVDSKVGSKLIASVGPFEIEVPTDPPSEEI